jgi:hypothetical protein
MGSHNRQTQQRIATVTVAVQSTSAATGDSIAKPRSLISSASGLERGEVFYGPTDWLGSRDPLTPVRYTRGSLFGLVD